LLNNKKEQKDDTMKNEKKYTIFFNENGQKNNALGTARGIDEDFVWV